MERKRARDASGLVRRVRSRAISKRIPRTIFSGECNFTRSCTIAVATTAAAGWNIGASNFAALCAVFDPTAVTMFGSAVAFLSAGLPNAAEIAAMWDLVMIDKVEITVDHYNDPTTSGGATGMPRLAICNDYNDGAAGTTVSSIQQHSDCRYSGSRTTKHVVKPKFQRLSYYTALSSSYEPARSYVNADTAIPHYGTHFGICDVTSLATGRTLFNFKMFLRAKNVK